MSYPQPYYSPPCYGGYTTPIQIGGSSLGCATSYEPEEKEERYSEVVSPYPTNVSTPWIRNLSFADGIAVGREVIAFGTFFSPTTDEQAKRDQLRRMLQQYVSIHCSCSTVKFIGSVGIGVALPTSAIDLVVEGWTATPEAVTHIASLLRDSGYVRVCCCCVG